MGKAKRARREFLAETGQAALGLGGLTAAGCATPWRGARTHQYTYVVNEQWPWLLYDSQEDFFQMHNLVNDPARAGLRKEMHALTADWLKTAGDPFNLKI